jgi:hypothetical protein
MWRIRLVPSMPRGHGERPDDVSSEHLGRLAAVPNGEIV